MEIPNSGAKEDFPNGGENRVADVTVLPRHRARSDAALEAVSHHQVKPFAQLIDEGIEILEVIAVVGVAHDAIAALRRGDRAVQRRPVAANRDMNHARAKTGCNLLRAVG